MITGAVQYQFGQQPMRQEVTTMGPGFLFPVLWLARLRVDALMVSGR